MTTMLDQRPIDHYDGAAPFTDAGPAVSTRAGQLQIGVTLAIVLVPFAGLVAAVWLAWGHGAADRAGHRRVDELRGRCHRLGRHPPPASRVHRSARRPAFPLPVRHQR